MTRSVLRIEADVARSSDFKDLLRVIREWEADHPHVPFAIRIKHDHSPVRFTSELFRASGEAWVGGE